MRCPLRGRPANASTYSPEYSTTRVNGVRKVLGRWEGELPSIPTPVRPLRSRPATFARPMGIDIVVFALPRGIELTNPLRKLFLFQEQTISTEMNLTLKTYALPPQTPPTLAHWAADDSKISKAHVLNRTAGKLPNGTQL